MAPGAPGTELNGTWETSCFDNNGFNFARTTIAYNDLALTGTFTEYEDAACTRATHVSRWTGVGTVAGTTPAGETKLDLSFVTFTSTSLTTANADFNNTNRYCGFTDWVCAARGPLFRGAPRCAAPGLGGCGSSSSRRRSARRGRRNREWTEPPDAHGRSSSLRSRRMGAFIAGWVDPHPRYRSHWV
jgi:hypothetical protein